MSFLLKSLFNFTFANSFFNCCLNVGGALGNVGRAVVLYTTFCLATFSGYVICAEISSCLLLFISCAFVPYFRCIIMMSYR
ncbi:unnamed protein product [Brugia timori]|uniref:Ovule protein n=1 Tax=Brugia timori TaxID=42155 RepID=A0A0R3QXW1_9BILA|nr:unnamed protein product [Brugia timori]